MSWLSRLFGKDDIVDKAADGIYNGIDKLVHTKEERTEASMQGMKLYLEFMKETKPAALARRYIAIAVTGFWGLTTSIYATLVLMSSDLADKFFPVLEYINNPFMVIIGFYFLKHVAANIKQ